MHRLEINADIWDWITMLDGCGMHRRNKARAFISVVRKKISCEPPYISLPVRFGGRFLRIPESHQHGSSQLLHHLQTRLLGEIVDILFLSLTRSPGRICPPEILTTAVQRQHIFKDAISSAHWPECKPERHDSDKELIAKSESE
jgi:hypothetical protein